MHSRSLIAIFLSCGTLVLSAAEVQGAQDDQAIRPLTCTVSWIANTFGAPDKWVQMEAESMITAADGTCLTNTFWEEGGGNVGIYRDGDLLGSAGHTRGWGYEGGSSVAANDRYVFIVQEVGNEGGGLKAERTWPAKGKFWHGISRRRTDGRTPAIFKDGKGGDGPIPAGCFKVVNEIDDRDREWAGRIRGLAADAKRLYVSSPGTRSIKIYDVETMDLITEWPIAGTRQIALAADGRLWAIQVDGDQVDREHSDSDVKPASIIHIAADGKILPERIEGIAKPAALAIDNNNRLLVADDGPDQQIKIFDLHGPQPQQVDTLGTKGGVFAGRRGEVGPLRFNGLVGVGADRAGNTYVCSSATGLVMEGYSSERKRTWSVTGLTFLDCADVDPGSDADVYTKEEHIVMDYAKPPGKEWRYQGVTVDRFAYPNDARCGHAEFASTKCRRIKGKLVVFGIDMYANHLLIYRPSGKDEILVPSGMVVKAHFSNDKDPAHRWPAHQPSKGEWIWRDANGNGDFDAGEYESTGKDAPEMHWGWWIDDEGDIWQAGSGGVRRLPFQGFDVVGNPIWSFAKAELKPVPPLFTGVERVIPDPKHDRVIISGFSKDFPNRKGNWKTPGKVIACYEQWNKQPKKIWEIHPPFDEEATNSKTYGTPVAITSAGDYVFVAYLISAEVRVYALADGAYVGSFIPPKGMSGWVDTPYGINAHRRSDGEYIVIVEEVWKAKNMLYRWKPVR